MDEIALTGLRAFAHHGVFDYERADGQEFVIDVVLGFDLERPGKSDLLEDTIDYGELAGAIVDRVRDETWNLIERVALRVAELVLEDDRVDTVSVTVHKPEAPIEVGFDDVAVTIKRQR